MNEPRPTPELVLDYLYGLLDGPEAERVRAWLATPEGAAAQREAERVRALFAAAAKSEFPQVRFTAPPVQPAAARAAFSKERMWGWFVAAAMLIAVGSPVVAHYWSMRLSKQEYEAAVVRRDAARKALETVKKENQKTLAEVNESLVRAESAYAKTKAKLDDKLNEVANELRAKQIAMVISGPARIQPGAPNVFQIQTVDGRNRPAAAMLSMRVKDQDNRVVFEEKAARSNGTHSLKLPADLPFTPQRDLYLEVEATGETGPMSELREQLPLAVPYFLTELTTDKPMYQPGENVLFRSLTLERFTLKPPGDEFALQYVVLDGKQTETAVVSGTTKLQANGSPVLGPDGKPVAGVGAGEWAIPATAAGGEYTLVVREAKGRFPEARRKFLVNQYQPARFNKELEWSRKSYGPGDLVIANCKASRAEGGALADRPVQASATVDGVAIPVEPVTNTDSEGRVAVRFTLPKTMDRGVGSVNVVFSEGGVESLNKPIPIVLKKLDIEFFPEGGDLVAGAPNRVYFQSLTTLGKPADISGRIVDGGGREIARTATLNDDKEPGINQGMGRFEFVPEFGHAYKLVIENPVGIEGEYPLPPVKAEGVVLTAMDDVSGDPAPIRVRIYSPGSPRALLVGAYARGRLLDHQRIAVAANGSADVALKPEGGVGGVARVTVFEELDGEGPRRPLKPIAERLVYRKPASSLNLTVRPDKSRYVPGDRAKLAITATNETEQPASAVLYLGVVNKSVVAMADEKTARSLPTHFLLTTEVRKAEDLEHADVLLGPHPKATAALDLMLGTQGWRRFAEQTPEEFRQKRGEDANPIFMAYGFTPDSRREFKSLELEARKVKSSFAAALDESKRMLEERQRIATVVSAKVANDAEQARLDKEIGAEDQVMCAVTGRLSTLDDAWRRTLDWLLPVACAAFLFVGIAMLVLALLRGVRLYAVAAGALALATIAALFLALHIDGKNLDMSPENVGAMADAAPRPLGSVVNAPKAPALAEREMLEDKAAPKPMPGPVSRAGASGLGGTPKRDLQDAPAPAGAAPVPPAPPGAKPAEPDPAAMRRAIPATGNAKPQEKKAEARDDKYKDDGKKLGVDVLRMQRDRKAPADNKGNANLGAGIEGGRAKDAGKGDEPAAGRGAGFHIIGGAGGKGPGEVPQLAKIMARAERPAPQPLVVRQYAYQHSQSSSADRSDFAETLFWHPVLVVPKTGTEVSFDLSDSVTRYRVLAAGHTLDGRLGSVTTEFEARKPLTIEPKLPVEITAGDRLDVPVTLVNDTDTKKLLKLHAEPKGLTLSRGNLDVALTMAPLERSRQLYRFQPTIKEGVAELRFSGTTDSASDSISVPLPVVPEGFPVIGSVSDVLERVARHDVVLPPTWVPGTLKCQVSVFPSTLAELQRGLEGLLREPGGCFEQTSTTNYPNALILDYMRESEQSDPSVVARAKGLLERGYAKLTAFEVPADKKREGFEWFGQAPAHEALTAYGLMQFRDMARVSDVDAGLIRRTSEYLLSRRDGQGGFQRNPRALDTFGRAPQETTNAYIIWAITESGKDDDVAKELDLLAKQAKGAKDPYFLALVANALLNRDRADEALAILESLATALTKDGFLDGAQTSITGSRGRTLQIETTALAVLGWLKANRPADFAAATRSAVGWIGKQRGGYGGFGSTQSTILALKALIAYTKANKQMAEAGELTLSLGDRAIGRLPFTAGTSGELTIAVPDADKLLKPGKNDLRVEIGGKNTYPYTLTWSYPTIQPPSAEGCAVRLDAKLDKAEMAEGDAAQLKVQIENVSGKGQGMTVAVLGLPAGLKLPDDFKQLRELSRLQADGKPGTIGAFEVRGRELVLYWRDLAPKAKIDLAIDVRGHVPGEFTGPASRGYLYYDADTKHWIPPLAIKIKAKE